MKEKPTTVMGLQPEQLAAMMGIGQETDSSAQHSDLEVKRCLIESWLARSLQWHVANAPRVLTNNKNARRLLPLSGSLPASTLLLDRHTSLGVLELLRDAAQISAHEGIGLERSIAAALYHASIASALLFHRKCVLPQPKSELTRAFRILAAKRWMPPELVSHFQYAIDKLQAKAL